MQTTTQLKLRLCLWLKSVAIICSFEQVTAVKIEVKTTWVWPIQKTCLWWLYEHNKISHLAFSIWCLLWSVLYLYPLGLFFCGMMHQISKKKNKKKRLYFCTNIFDIYVTEYGTALTTILPILFLYLNTVIVTAGTFEP